jgi:hypothetical protein
MKQQSTTTRSRGFAIADALALVAVSGVLAALGLATSGQPGSLTGARQSARQLKDSTHIRQLMQSMITWSINNKDQYPLPSVLDRRDKTVKAAAVSKNHTANIMSIMIWNGSISPELTISPLENNKNIEADADYALASPKAAAVPADALWDPAFSADFTAKAAKGNVSYAHLQYAGGRKSRWANTFNSDEAVISNRGPEITAVTVHDEFTATPSYADANSNTFKFYTPAGAWSGNVGFNDAHVEFVKDHFRPGAKVTTGAFYLVKDKDTGKNKKLPDMSFFDEPDDAASTNNFLGIFTTAGEKPAEYKAIWD